MNGQGEAGRRSEQSLPEPDYRFTLANERTLLAWVRTGLALLAGGVALSHFDQVRAASDMFRALAIALVIISMAAVAGGMLRWWQCQQAIGREQPLPVTRLPWMLAAGVLLAGGMIVGLALFFSGGR